jgi:hypothetical protein
MKLGSPRTTISVPMAAPSIVAAYPNSDDSGRAKERPFFKREEIQEFFETCPPDLVSSPELRTVFGMWLAAGKPFGSEIQFFKAIKHYCRGAVPKYKSESTVRSNIRRAEDSGILEVAYRDRRGNCHHIWIRERNETDRGLYRRVTTHRLSIPLLLKWRHRQGQESQANVEPIRKPAQPTQPEDPRPPATAAPNRAPAKTAAHRSSAPRLTPRQRAELGQRIQLYEHGVTRLEYTPARAGMDLELRPGDPAYVKPLPRPMAILAACKSMCQGDGARGLKSMGCAMDRAREAAEEMEQT